MEWEAQFWVAEAIYNFLKKKIKKNLTFVNNLNSNADYFNDKNINLNLIISKSGEYFRDNSKRKHINKK